MDIQKPFSALCQNEPNYWLDSGYYNSDYTTWIDGCLRKVSDRYRNDYSYLFKLDEKEKEKLASQNQQLTNQNIVLKQESGEKFLPATVGGIGAGAAAGGGLLFGGLPLIFKAITRLLVK